MHPQSQAPRHPVRRTAVQLAVGLFAIIGLGVVLYLLFIGALVIGITALVLFGLGALLARRFKRPAPVPEPD